MRFFDTPRSRLIDFVPDGQRVGMYVCGITPYDAAHLGHIFTFLAYDLLQRRLEDQGYEVRLVRNVTDVDEPIFARAAETGEDYRQLAARETKRLQDVLRRLHFRTPYAEPKASEYVGQMAAAVQQLLRDGHAYRLKGPKAGENSSSDIYFDVNTQPGFGSFSGFPERLLLGFMAGRGGDPERPGKRNPLDFLLWRGINDPDDPAAWDSPVGRGRPGWHIECSIMSAELLGTPLDIHGGGMDLIFPHHECEIAQSVSLIADSTGGSSGQAATGSAYTGFAKHWLHVAPLSYHGEKMSKSLGNLVFAHELLERYSPATLRLSLMHYHYRIGGEWQDEYLGHAAGLARLLQKALDHPCGIDLQSYGARIREALDDDLDTPRVIGILHDMAAAILASDEPHASCGRELRGIISLLGLAGDSDANAPVRLV